MTKSRTIRWILPIAALVVLGYFGWQRFHADPAAQADNAQKAAAAARNAAFVAGATRHWMNASAAMAAIV